MFFWTAWNLLRILAKGDSNTAIQDGDVGEQRSLMCRYIFILTHLAVAAANITQDEGSQGSDYLLTICGGPSATVFRRLLGLAKNGTSQGLLKASPIFPP